MSTGKIYPLNCDYKKCEDLRKEYNSLYSSLSSDQKYFLNNASIIDAKEPPHESQAFMIAKSENLTLYRNYEIIYKPISSDGLGTSYAKIRQPLSAHIVGIGECSDYF